MAAAEGVTHPESLRHQDRNNRNTLESAAADISSQRSCHRRGSGPPTGSDRRR